jgi:hypothetical protein
VARRLRRGALGPAAIAAVALAVVLGGCASSNAQALVRQACGHVDTSVALFERSLHEAGSAATADRSRSLEQLRDGLPDAATAAGEDAEWQALMTTIAESSRVPEGDLVKALQRQCGVAQSSGST